MNTKKITLGSLFISVLLLFILCSCIMDRKTTFFIKNSTNDTLLIELSESDTLVNKKYWSKRDEEIKIPVDSKELETVLSNSIIGHFAIPNAVLFVNPSVFLLNDTCYIYAIKWSEAKHNTFDEIRTRRLYDKRVVTKDNFNSNNLFEYKKE